VVKRARHNQYAVKKTTDTGHRHTGPPTVRMANKPRPTSKPTGQPPVNLELTA
jgi:hypothetical protein